jgi:hypothetical protein
MVRYQSRCVCRVVSLVVSCRVVSCVGVSTNRARCRYIADEPDGPGDDPALAVAAYRLVKRLDPRHPVSLVLNCRDSSPSFLEATDIMMTDVYPIGARRVVCALVCALVCRLLMRALATVGIDTTRCNATFGVCGCDGCEGRPSDVAHRLDHYRRSWPPALRHRMPIWIGISSCACVRTCVCVRVRVRVRACCGL